jgi:hypothetical protein
MGIFFIFYLTQKLFYVNGLNDFDEYFIKAEMWSNGEWTWAGGPDKLLSLIMYFPILIYKNDFFAFYRATQIVLISLLFISLCLFILRKNEIFPEFNIKLLISVLLLSMPFFAVETVTVDASLLYCIMLIFFLTTYNNKYLGFISLLVYLARPESVMIFMFYILFFILDQKNRKSIVLNFLSFIALLLFFKFYLEPKVLQPGITVFADYQLPSVATEKLSDNYFVLFFKALKFIFIIPLFIVGYAMEILQSYLLLTLFLIGLAFSVTNKKMFAFYGFFIFYLILVFAINGFNAGVDLSEVANKVPMKFINNNFDVVNGRNMENNIFGHSRYRVFLYPAIAAFIIMGVSVIINLFRRIFLKEQSNIVNVQPKVKSSGKRVAKQVTDNTKKPGTMFQKAKDIIEKLKNPFHLPSHTNNSKAALSFIIMLILFINMNAYFNFSNEYKLKNQMNDVYMNDFYHLGFKVRENMKSNDIVLMPNMCNCNISFIIEFLTFSGNRYVMTPLCDSCNNMYTINRPDNKYFLSAAEVKEKIPSKTVIFDRYSIDYQKTFAPENVERTNKLFDKFDLSMLDSLNIRYIITNQELNPKNLVKNAMHGDWFLYENMNLSK